MSSAIATLEIVANDVSGQKKIRASSIPGLTTIGDLTRKLVTGMGLMPRDAKGKPLDYRLRLERDGRQLSSSELTEDVLRTGDEVTVTPRIAAGC